MLISNILFFHKKYKYKKSARVLNTHAAFFHFFVPSQTCRLNPFSVKSRSKIKEGATTGWFAKFPKDIVLCEEILNGDVHILEKEPYVEKNERPNYRAIFGSGEENSPKKKTGNQPGSGTRGRKRKAGADAAQSSQSAPPPKRAIVHPRFKGGRSDHNVKILTQPSSPYHMDLIKSPGSDVGTPTSTNANKYNCQICGFSASRLNVIILHNKTHRYAGADTCTWESVADE